jgi:eukaryotic-like serine/threonine-protein kinase
MKVTFEIVHGDECGKVFVLDEPTICLGGRSLEAPIRLSADPFISRNHFLIEFAPPNVYFKDLETVTNNTKINGLVVVEAKLCDGDVIEVGFTKLKVSLKPDLQMTTIHCKKCGRPVKIFNGESQDAICPECEDKWEKEERIRISLIGEKSPPKVNCECGKDLTNIANSDGRARELMGKVDYFCKGCVPEKEVGNRQINDYEIIKDLGKGAMGKVCLAYHTPTARLVALKEMHIEGGILAARFNQEIRVVKIVLHENALCFIDNGQDKLTGKAYLVMEYASGGNMEDVFMKHPATRPGSRLGVVRCIIESLKGLAHIHGQRIVHRDIKPENILFKDEKRKTPKVADFGLAKEYSGAGGTRITKFGQGLGTPYYMPPEQFKDARDVTETADLYSMGVTLYRLLTGTYPFDFSTSSPRNFYQIVLDDSPIPIRERCPHLSTDLAAVVDKAVEKDVRKRFQSADEFRLQLEKVNDQR